MAAALAPAVAGAGRRGGVMGTGQMGGSAGDLLRAVLLSNRERREPIPSARLPSGQTAGQMSEAKRLLRWISARPSGCVLAPSVAPIAANSNKDKRDPPLSRPA